MIQNVIHAFFRPIRFINFLHRFKMGIPAMLLLLAFLGSTNQLIAGSSFRAPAAIVADTTIKAQICDNESFEFAGHLLDTAGVYVAVFTGTDGSDSTVTLVLSVLPVPVTNLHAGICEGTSYIFQGDTLNMSGTYADTLTAVNGCDSIVTLQLNVAGFFETPVNAAICEGTSYPFAGLLLTESGTYIDSLTAIGGCDSTIILKLAVLPTIQTYLEAAVCDGDFYLFSGDTLSIEGFYTDSLQAVTGCDSIVTLLLHVFPVEQTQLEATICASQTFLFNGTELSEEGEYSIILPSFNGCDSTVTLVLHVIQPLETTIAATICFGETYSLGEEEIIESGVYTATLTSAAGCDSIVTLTLTILPEQLSIVSATICSNENYLFNGDLLEDEGLYEAVFTDVNGCDSIVTLTLTVLPTAASVIDATICGNENYPFFGEILNQSGQYTATATAANGCDSIITLNLTVLPLSTTDLSFTVCYGGTYNYFGEILSETGLYHYTYPAANGCDSLVNLTLIVLPENSTTLEKVLCFGDIYILNGDTLDTDGVYTATLTDNNGCDSTVTITLTILPEQLSVLSATVCANVGYLFDGELLLQDGVYTAVFASVNGCDSTVTLTLTVLPTAASVVDATICGNGAYPFYGTVLNQTGQYTATIPAANGCDSVITLNLTVLPLPATDILITLCHGDSYDYFGETLTETGYYAYTYPAANGCDSLVNLTLIVLPENITQFEVGLCTGSSYELNGDLLTTDGTYTAIMTDQNGCDSTVIVTLTFVNAFETSLSATICSGQVYDYQGVSLTETGVYTYNYTAVGGCDSIVTVTLEVLPAYNSTISATICANESYSFDGNVLATSGVYTADYVTSGGCDSIVILTLTVLPVAVSDLEVNTCAGTPYAFNGLSLSVSGVYVAHLTSANGCDSTVTLVLTVNPTYQSTINATICANESYLFNGQNLNSTGFYLQQLSTISGCDSNIVLHLTVLPVKQSTLNITSCNGQPYVYNNTPFGQSGTYPFTFNAANGCDSVVTLHLTVVPAITPLTIIASICEGETYAFGNQVLASPGAYSVTYSSVSGCDSVILLNLSVVSLNSGITLNGNTLTSAAASDVSYQWINCTTQQLVNGANGASFTPAVTGTYAVQVTNPDGCTAQSECITVTVVSTREPVLDITWSIQPNPAVSEVSIHITEPADETIFVSVTDLAGRQILSQKIGTGATMERLNIAALAEGMYLIKLSDSSGSAVKRFVKVRS